MSVSESTPATPRPRPDWLDPWQVLLPIVAALALTAATMSLLSVVNTPRFSLLDEATHLDYAWRASRFEQARTGQHLSQETLSRWSCRGQAMANDLPPCTAPGELDPADFPEGGEQYNAFHPPLYYWVTGLSARPLAALAGVEFVTAARAMGAVWLFGGMLGLYLSLRYWRVRWLYAMCASILLATLPSILHASSMVTNDAPAALCGVAAVFVLGRQVVRDRNGWILPAALTALAGATKTLNVLPLATVAIVLGVRAALTWRRGDRPLALRRVAGPAAIALTAAIVHLGWSAFTAMTRPEGYVNPVGGLNTRPIEGWPFDEWIPTLVGGLQMGKDFYLDPFVSSPYLTAWATLSTIMLGAGVLAALARFGRGSARWYLAVTALVGAFLYPLAVQLQAFESSGEFFHHLPTRYGMAFIPLGLALLAMLAEDLHLRRTSVAVTVVGVLAAFSGAASLMA